MRPAWLHRRISDLLRDMIRRQDEKTAHNYVVSVDQALIMAVLYLDEGEYSVAWLSGIGLFWRSYEAVILLQKNGNFSFGSSLVRLD